MPGLVVPVDDLSGHLEKSRPFRGLREVSIRLGDSAVAGPLHVAGTVRGTTDGVHANFTATALARMKCARCLVEWDQEVGVEGSQHFSRIPDEDGYAIVAGQVDVGAPAVDELALALPAAPVHDPDCRGLCPICGTDLNREPCDGHGEDPDSPFSVLEDLFDS